MERFADQQQALLNRLLTQTEGECATALAKEMQELMTEQVGIYRDQKQLSDAVEKLQQLLQRSQQVKVVSKAPGANPELTMAYRLPRMLKLALCVAQGALNRTESRGAHCRVDYPKRDDQKWLNRTLARWPEGATEPQLNYEPLDVMTMELPPGWRGYGSTDYIAHPDAASRQQEVDIINAQHSDRFQRQQALLPFKQLLPNQYHNRNARFQEDTTANIDIGTTNIDTTGSSKHE